MNLESLLNNFITGGIRSADLETLKKFKVLNTFLFILILGSPCLGLFYFFIGADLLFYTTIIAGLLGISGMIVLRKTKNLVVGGNYAFFVLWAAFLIIRWNTGAMTEGGLVLLSWIWNAVLILMAIFITGYLWGTIWATLIFVETGVAVYLFRSGYKFPHLIPHDISPFYSLGAYLSGLLVMLLIAFMYEKDKTDVTDRERVKSRALVESKKYIDTIIERSPLPTFVIDSEHRVIQWNHACQQMTGIPMEETVGRKVHASLCVDNERSLADIIIDDPDAIAEKFSDSILSQTDTGYFEVKMPLPAIKEGIQAIITVAPILDVSGSIRGAIETIQDVSSVQEATHQVHYDFARTTESLSNPVFNIDSKGKISSWNRACEEKFGYPSSVMIGNNPLRFVSKSTRGSFKEAIVRVLKGEAVTGREWKYYTAQGEPVYVMARAFPVQADEGKSLECAVVNTDVTELQLKMRKVEQDAAEAKERLKKLSDEYALLRRNIASYIRKKE